MIKKKHRKLAEYIIRIWSALKLMETGEMSIGETKGWILKVLSEYYEEK